MNAGGLGLWFAPSSGLKQLKLTSRSPFIPELSFPVLSGFVETERTSETHAPRTSKPKPKGVLQGSESLDDGK